MKELLVSLTGKKIVGIALIFLVLSGCSIAPPGTDIHDPNEAHNRKVHEFNRAFNERFSADDGSTSSDPLIDPELTQPVVNFADNTGLPAMVLNGVLQGDIGAAATNAMRFVINTTIGIGGLFDPAGAIGLAEDSTDFGETLAVWGAPEGAYIELPFAGPTTERRLAGFVADALLDPLAAVGTSPQLDYGLPATVAALLIKRSQFSGTIDSVFESADSYTQQKLIFYQNRRFDLGQQGAEVDPYADLYGD